MKLDRAGKREENVRVNSSKLQKAIVGVVFGAVCCSLVLDRISTSAYRAKSIRILLSEFKRGNQGRYPLTIETLLVWSQNQPRMLPYVAKCRDCRIAIISTRSKVLWTISFPGLFRDDLQIEISRDELKRAVL